MGLLETTSGERHRLWGDHLVGRAPDAALRIDDPSVSWRHASLRWNGRLWELQDLGSLNGTFMDGQRLSAGTRVPLRTGAQLRFGEHAQVFLLSEADPPWPSAVALDTGERHVMDDGMIGLPDPDAPALAIYQDADGRWVRETSEGVREVPSGGEIEVSGRRFRFEPGAVIHATSATSGNVLTPASVGLEFEVSRNEEHVDITIVHRKRRVSLRPRAHSYMLLTLARLRKQDQERAQAASAVGSHGWVDQQDLLKMLATTPSQLALDIFRARRQFGDAGVVDSAHIIERRVDSHELRIGVERLQIQVT